ncbi:MAG TPA: hypothetical protein VGU44_04775, partial [Gammaproteobacteria bacterium]|nr:hypothetical protein [Gammaproteobacteria bacterium]
MPSFDELAQERVKLLYEYQYGNDSERTANKTRLKENEKKLKLDVKKNKFKSDYLKEWFGKNPFDLPKLDKKPKDISFDIDEFNFLNDQRSALLRKIKSPSTPKAEKMNALNAFKKNTEALTPHMKSINELKEIVEQLEIDIPRSQQAVNRATAKLNHRLEKTLTVPLKENPVLSSLQQPTYLAHLSDKLTEAKKN